MINSLVQGDGYERDFWKLIDSGLPTGQQQTVEIASGTAETDLFIVTRAYCNHEGYDGYMYVSILIDGNRISDSYVARNYPGWGGDWKSYVPRASSSAICPKGKSYSIKVEYSMTFPDTNPDKCPLVEFRMLSLGCKSRPFFHWFRPSRRIP